MTDSFSVLLSLYYKENPSFLRQSLASVFNQTLLPSEIVLVEDGPLTPELYAVLDEYSEKSIRLIRIKLDRNMGLGSALNEGIKHCCYDLIVRMDTDDICLPIRFERQINFMMEHIDIDVCSSWIQEFEGNVNNIIAIKKVPQTHGDVAKYLIRRNPINHPAVVFRKKAVLTAGNYLPFPLFEDWYLWVRMLASGAKFSNIQEVLLSFRTSSDMYMRRGGWKYAKNNIKLQREFVRLGVIGVTDCLFNVSIRTLIYLLPNKIRKWFYIHILR